MIKKLFFIGCALAVMLSFAGCMKWEEPEMLDKNYKDTPFRAQNREKNREKDIIYGQASAQSGWSWLHEYLRTKNNTFYLKNAGRMFNMCWFFDPQNYNSYWGWGIVMGERATLANEKEAEKFLISSLELFQLASEKDIPATEKSKFQLDWANACNGMGAYDKQNHNIEKSQIILNKGKSLLLDVLQEYPKNGRAYFLLSVNYYYRGDVSQAKQYANQALEYGFQLPDGYIDELNK